MLKKRTKILFFNGTKDCDELRKGFLNSFSQTSFPGGHSEWEPPDPFSNSEVKTLSADGSVGSPHVRVGHRQDLIQRRPQSVWIGAFFVVDSGNLLLSHGEMIDFRSEVGGVASPRFLVQSNC